MELFRNLVVFPFLLLFGVAFILGVVEMIRYSWNRREWPLVVMYSFLLWMISVSVYILVTK